MGRGDCRANQCPVASLASQVPMTRQGATGPRQDSLSLKDNDLERWSRLNVRIDIHFLPAEQAPALELHQALLDDLAEMAPLPGVNEDFAGGVHEAECSRFEAIFNPEKL